jgi:hypothetical protein
MTAPCRSHLYDQIAWLESQGGVGFPDAALNSWNVIMKSRTCRLDGESSAD